MSQLFIKLRDVVVILYALQLFASIWLAYDFWTAPTIYTNYLKIATFLFFPIFIGIFVRSMKNAAMAWTIPVGVMGVVMYGYYLIMPAGKW